MPDLTELAEHLKAAEYEVRWDSAIPGTRRFYSDGPLGNWLEFIAEGQGLSQRSTPAAEAV